jgi:hypothetical protein
LPPEFLLFRLYESLMAQPVTERGPPRTRGQYPSSELLDEYDATIPEVFVEVVTFVRV